MVGSLTLSSLILKSLNDRATRFVFPSAVASAYWMEFSAEATLSAVAKDRFIAWDDFKAETLAEGRKDRRPANSAARSIFSAALLAENAEAASRGTPFFAELISRDHAASYGAFVSSLARSIPALDGLVSRSNALAKDDPYFADLAFVRTRYGEFLDRYGLFEPSWNRVPFRPSASRWILVCPELAEDWGEYAAELSGRDSVRIVSIKDLAMPYETGTKDATRHANDARRILGDATGRLLRFGSAHEEIRWIALAVGRLLKEGTLEPSDITISIPNVEDYAERLLLEFRLRDIPADLRAGRSISDQPVGRLFSALAACPATRWSYRALKDLLLDAALPWKDREKIDALMEFGLRYRCVSGFPENGKNVDVWERSFERLRDHSDDIHFPLGKIQHFYNDLKRDITYIATASSFVELREHILKFKTNHFDDTVMDVDMDRILSRSLDELADLAETERRLEGLRVERPFDLFRTHLRGIPYVFQAKSPGVRIYDYRVSALIAPAVHIIANATQNAATVRANPAPFLREDRKLRARVDERDMSGDFIAAYSLSGEAVVFTASAHGFTTHSVPHRALSEETYNETATSKEAGRGPDPLEVELDLALGRIARTANEVSSPAALCVPTTVQKLARKAVQDLAAGVPPLDVRRSPIRARDTAAAVRARLTRSEDGERLSPTNLNEFNACAYSWFLRRGLGVREKQTEIETIDQRELGTLYHRILQRLFDRIQTEDARFRQERLPLYKDFLVQEVDAALEEARANEGAFQESVYAMLKPRLISALSAYLDADAARLDSCAILGAEFPLKREYPELGPALSGVADLVLKMNDGSLAIVDFNTGLMPATADLVPDADGLLGDLQMASYVRMAEGDGSVQVRAARFYSIDNRNFRPVLADEERLRANARLPLSRDEYGTALDAVDETMQAAAGALVGAEYPVPPPGSRAACATCRVISVCRLPFAGGEP
jgi:hypothetical protein